MPGPPLSDDGRFWWDGERWQAAVIQNSGKTTPGEITSGILSAVVIIAIFAAIIGYIIAVIVA